MLFNRVHYTMPKFEGILQVEIYATVEASTLEEAMEKIDELCPIITVEGSCEDYSDNSDHGQDWEVKEVKE